MIKRLGLIVAVLLFATQAFATGNIMVEDILNNVYDSTNTALKATISGNADMGFISADGITLQEFVSIDSSVTTGTALTVTADAVTTGNVASFWSSSTSTAARNIVEIRNKNAAAAGANCLLLQQLGNEDCIDIDMDGNDSVLFVDSESTSGHGLYLDFNAMQNANMIAAFLSAMTSGYLIDCDNMNALTTGGALYLKSNSADNTPRELIDVVNANTSSTTTTVLSLDTGALGVGALISCVTADNAQCFIVSSDGGVHMPKIKFGTSQAAAEAIAGELWYDTDDADTIKIGT